MGYTITELADRLQVDQQAVSDAMGWLYPKEEGFVYNTIDADHFAAMVV